MEKGNGLDLYWWDAILQGDFSLGKLMWHSTASVASARGNIWREQSLSWHWPIWTLVLVHTMPRNPDVRATGNGVRRWGACGENPDVIPFSPQQKVRVFTMLRYALTWLIETEGLLKVAGSHVHCKFGNISEMVQDRRCYYRPWVGSDIWPVK